MIYYLYISVHFSTPVQVNFALDELLLLLFVRQSLYTYLLPLLRDKVLMGCIFSY